MYDVVVIGLGPVGSLLTLLLAKQGLSVAVIERDEKVYTLPRAVNLDGEIVRALQPWKLAEPIDALLQKNRPGERAGFANSKREWLFGQTMRDSGACGWQPMNFFDQPEVEQFLRDQALSADNVTPFIGFEASQVSQSQDDVTLTATRAANASEKSVPQTVTGHFLIACDGASSAVRRSLEINWVDLGYDQDWLVVDIETLPGHTLDHSTVQVCDPKRLSTYVCTKDPYRRWEFRLNEGETWEEMLTPQKVASLIAPWTPPDTYTVRRKAVYQFHAAIAQAWQKARIFIAGDAAHQSPPFLGQGMNSGMRDAINLAWKLPLVIRGVSQPALLETYESERKAHAHDLVDWAVSIGNLMSHLAEVEAAETLGESAPARPKALERSGYGQGRETPSLKSGVLMTHQVSDEGITGTPYYQPVIRYQNQTQRLDELLGPGFALVLPEPMLLSETALAIMAKLKIQLVCAADFEIVRGRLSSERNAVLIRPDRYVFGHTDVHTDIDTLLSALCRKLCLSDL
jgi:3-(3-hydroxy-phenyl)propionate hydroxylase